MIRMCPGGSKSSLAARRGSEQMFWYREVGEVGVDVVNLLARSSSFSDACTQHWNVQSLVTLASWLTCTGERSAHAVRSTFSDPKEERCCLGSVCAINHTRQSKQPSMWQGVNASSLQSDVANWHRITQRDPRANIRQSSYLCGPRLRLMNQVRELYIRFCGVPHEVSDAEGQLFSEL
jgi:hypothetical protein